MQAVAVFPARREVRLVEHPEPALVSPSQVKLRMLEVGVCGTDRELCNFQFGSTPAGEEYFVLGHESLAEVVECGPQAKGLAPGDLAVALVRHPCGDSACEPCAAGHQDFCHTGLYSERGIFSLHGFMTEFVVEEGRYLRAVPRELRDAAVLIEPLTIAEKAFAGFRALDARQTWRKDRRTAVVLGSGPIGLLGAMLLRSAGFETWVYSRTVRTEIIEAIGARAVSSREADPEKLAAMTGRIDLVYEAMGAPQCAFDVLRRLGANGVFIFTGAPARGTSIDLSIPKLTLNLMVQNQAILGTVNSGPQDFDAAIADLAGFRQQWPAAVAGMITSRYPIEGFRDAIFGRGVKNVIALG